MSEGSSQGTFKPPRTLWLKCRAHRLFECRFAQRVAEDAAVALLHQEKLDAEKKAEAAKLAKSKKKKAKK